MNPETINRTAFFDGQWARRAAPTGGWQGKMYREAYTGWAIVWSEKVPGAGGIEWKKFERAQAENLDVLFHKCGFSRKAEFVCGLAAYHSLLDTIWNYWLQCTQEVAS